MRNENFPAPCWRNKSIIPVHTSDYGPYLTDVWMVLLRPAQGRRDFMMGDVITSIFLRVSVIAVRGYFKV